MTQPDALPRLLAGAVPRGAATLGDHLAHHGLPDLAVDPAALVAEVEAAGLRGRGGGAFPTASKLHAVARGRRRPIVVANGAEGEPASAKDRTLLAAVPHLVLDGIQLAALAVGAREAILCVREQAHAARAALAGALGERARAGRDAVRVEVEPIPDGYVAGEESALVHYLNDGPATPTFTPPRPFERGVRGRPTLVHNVETLAQLAVIARHGAAWFRRLGSQREPGTALVTVSGAVERPGVREIALGTPLGTVVEHAGGEPGRARAVLVGGYFGTWVDGGLAAALRLDETGLRPHGAALGCGVISVLPAWSCGVAETVRVVGWLAGQSAGQCGPCVFGLRAIADELAALAAGRAGRGALARIERWAGQLDGRGACRHPDGAVRLLRSALDVFALELEDHASRGRCDGCRETPVLPLPTRAARSFAPVAPRWYALAGAGR